jgi:hypothetical protein
VMACLAWNMGILAGIISNVSIRAQTNDDGDVDYDRKDEYHEKLFKTSSMGHRLLVYWLVFKTFISLKLGLNQYIQ